MKSKPYHHGDLRTAMIEKGIELINDSGARVLSLRKVAAACGVSHAAPYSHFANKDELLSAIENYITEKFASILKNSIKDTDVTKEGLVSMGCAYVLFFARNSHYFDFIFSRSDINFDDDYEPYSIYKKFMAKMFDNMDYPKELRVKTFISHWAMLHGLASIAVAAIDDPEEPIWEEQIIDLLSNNYLLDLS